MVSWTRSHLGTFCFSESVGLRTELTGRYRRLAQHICSSLAQTFDWCWAYRDLLYDLSGITANNCSGWHILENNAAGRNNRTCTNFTPWTDEGGGGHPGTGTHSDRGDG